MESQNLLALVDQLDGNLDNLEEALGPILDESLNTTSKKLPLLDRAKLNITVVYAIESLIFSYLKVNGVDPKNHAIFKEIERVKAYFAKIKEAEDKTVIAKPTITLNKQAAARIIQHSLAGNGSPDLTQREREARERLMQKLRQNKEKSSPVQTPAPVPADSSSVTASPINVQDTPQPSLPDQDAEMQEGSEEGEIDDDDPPLPMVQEPTPVQEISTRKRKQKHNSDPSSKFSADRKAEKKARKKAKKEAKATANGTS